MVDFDALVTAPCMDVFGEAVTYQPLGGVPFPITGVFDEVYREMMPVADFAPGNVSNSRSALGVRLAQFTGDVSPGLPQQNDALVVVRTGQRFLVNEVRADGKGWALLLLGDASMLA